MNFCTSASTTEHRDALPGKEAPKELIDQLSGGDEQRCRQGEAKRLGSVEVDPPIRMWSVVAREGRRASRP